MVFGREPFDVAYVSRSLLSKPYMISNFSQPLIDSNTERCSEIINKNMSYSQNDIMVTRTDILHSSSFVTPSPSISLGLLESSYIISNMSSAMFYKDNMSNIYITVTPTATPHNNISIIVNISTSVVSTVSNFLALTPTTLTSSVMPSPTMSHIISSDIKLTSSSQILDLTNTKTQESSTQPFIISTTISSAQNMAVSDQDYIIEKEKQVIRKVRIISN